MNSKLLVIWSLIQFKDVILTFQMLLKTWAGHESPLHATGNRVREQPRFIRRFARHLVNVVGLKLAERLDVLGILTVW
jgi:hypothetical protein